MSVVSEINRIKTNIANAYTELKNKNATIPSVENSEGLPSAIASIQTGGGTPITKGLIINECDSDGYATDVSIVGMTEIPSYYLYYAAYASGTNTGFLGKIGANLHLPNNLTKIGNNAFYGCGGLKITNLPETVITLGESAFSDCPALALTSLPSGLTSIANRVFRNCNKLALTSLPSGLTSIGQYGFYSCYELTLTSLPDNLTSIGTYAFYECRKLAITSIPSGVTSLSGNTCQYCSGLTEITFYGDMTSFGRNEFNSCTNLAKVVLPNVTSVPTIPNPIFAGTQIANKKGYIYVPDNLVDSFKSASNWSTYASQIKGVSEL